MKLLHDLVVRAAAADPPAVAVYSGPDSTSYGELDALAGRYASALVVAGVRPGDRILVWAEKSAHVIALMQGALRVGAVYVPVSPVNPAERVNRIADSCHPALIVTDQDRADAPSVTLAQLLERGGQAAAPVALAPDDPAYILYTSGSTGEPKGICLSHRNALAFVDWAVGTTGLGPGDRLASHAPFNFDLSVFDLYGAFAAGASVDLLAADQAYSAEGLTEFLRGRGITCWYSVPSALQLMMRQGGLLDAVQPSSLRVCVFAGEPFPLPEVQRLRRAWPGVRLLNWYGPTETNVCTSYEVTDADLTRTRPLPIGAACSGDTVSLADDGEIVVDGPTVMLGYWGRPRHEGPYHTGDLGRWDEHGNLEYLGRRDAMVKVRGHRVEPGDIEAVLVTHPTVVSAAVVVSGTGLDARLSAFVVPAAGTRPNLFSLKQLCAQRLPRYMIIDRLTMLTEFPRTPNGKTDRAALRAMASGTAAHPTATRAGVS
ncbi:clorobiocin biosynthesis protein CloN4 [Kibdelosporangium banguiense]|uniref:Clorobiocin biosynthesis protein CloN4 n=1 Tax=Kibdelosporangium banguiense TaxID=1365924 RepID=A0ABS4TW98_9PSEU|nr:amino acid adenylation domain-containing protein [Kibdelosporangium banguiense]MBP2328660.1 clorobiocin biosynthesis protein CloN4 [Kibdelosporangium banguiense]